MSIKIYTSEKELSNGLKYLLVFLELNTFSYTSDDILKLEIPDKIRKFFEGGFNEYGLLLSGDDDIPKEVFFKINKYLDVEVPNIAWRGIYNPKIHAAYITEVHFKNHRFKKDCIVPIPQKDAIIKGIRLEVTQVIDTIYDYKLVEISFDRSVTVEDLNRIEFHRVKREDSIVLKASQDCPLWIFNHVANELMSSQNTDCWYAVYSEELNGAVILDPPCGDDNDSSFDFGSIIPVKLNQ